MKHTLSCFAAACVAVLLVCGAGLLLVGSGTLVFAKSPAESRHPIVTDAPPAVILADSNGAPSFAKQSPVLPASSVKLAAESINPAVAKPGRSESSNVRPSADTASSSTANGPLQTTYNQAVSTANSAKFPRCNPVVEVVKKTKNAVVMVRVPRPNGAKDMIGTGVIIDPHGFIITNKHVVGDAKTVNVILADDTKITAEVIVGEFSYDLAILRIRTKKQLAYLPLAPNDPMVGETVIAIGHPFGYSNTVSTGIVSAFQRDIPMPSGDTLTGLIQTTASINPGNSGGPLFNINGEFIGLNVALREGAQNIAFSINVGTVKTFVRQHLSSVRVSGIQHGLQCSEKIVGETGNRQKVVVSWFQGSGDLIKGDEVVSIANNHVANTFDVERHLLGPQGRRQRTHENRPSRPGVERLLDRGGEQRGRTDSG